ncbi:MAG: ABC transporter ATP-binding protein [Lachnospiraceae bacterium]|nr:ABC transporter ATP-binding protein [Lachnospiraceae bacterium]
MRELKSIHKMGFRLLKMIHREDSTIIPLHLLELCLSLAQIYAGLFLTAGLIDALLTGAYAEAAWQAGYLLGANLLLGLAKHLLRRRFQSLGTRLWLTFYVWLREKVFAMDYESMEKPEVAEKILFSERTSDMYGGLDNLLNHYCNILQSILNLVLSVSLVIHLCLTRPAPGLGLVGGLAGPGPSLALFAALLFGMCACSWRAFAKYAAKQLEIFDSHTGVEERLSYMLNNVYGNEKAGKIIRIYGMEDMILENTAQSNQKSRDYFAKMCDVENAANDANNLVSSVFAVGAYLLAALKVVAGAVTVGAFTRYAGALNQFGSACFSLISGHGELRKVCTTMEDFLAFLDMENPHASGSIPVEKRDDGEYELAFENVSFHYPGSEEPVLKDVSFKLRIRGKLAVVGRNGAGKTTFIKLLCRLYEPTQGRITLNGTDIRKYDEEEYRSIFGVVFQDFKLFAFPVWENLAAGNERQDDRIWRALEQADAAELVRNMEKGLDTWLYKGVEDGVEISGGEAQKLALARALYKDAPVVILDEPTAALDPKAEAFVYERFGQMTEGRTSIYISHRMSSCRFCDEIIVFEDGKIVEQGDHETLLNAGGSYARMWEAQARYYA